MVASKLCVLFGTGVIVGVLNSFGGGGSFVGFPMLMFLGLSAIGANATATVATWPGTFSTLFAYKKDLKTHEEKLPFFAILSLVGGGIGALLVLIISNAFFEKIVPYLILSAAILFTFRTSLNKWVHKVHLPTTEHNVLGWRPHGLFVLLLLGISIYGGFFGAGLGILILATLGLMGMHNIHEMNAIRAVVGLCANTLALVVFGVSGIVAWHHVVVMGTGTILGGYAGAHFFQKLPKKWGQNTIIALAWSITFYFFIKMLHPFPCKIHGTLFFSTPRYATALSTPLAQPLVQTLSQLRSLF